MRKLIGGAAIVLVLTGIGFWLGRSGTQDVARAAPPPEAEAVTPPRVVRSMPQPMQRPALPRPAPVPGLAADLLSDNPAIRRAAVREAARQADPDPATMLAASRDRDVEVAGAAMASLAKLYADGRVSSRDMAERASDRAINPRVRGVALNGFGVVPDPDAAKLLVQLLGNGDEFERRTAAALLGNQDAELAMPALIRALGDADEYVRGNAHESLVLRSRGRDFGTDAGSWSAWWQSRR